MKHWSVEVLNLQNFSQFGVCLKKEPSDSDKYWRKYTQLKTFGQKFGHSKKWPISVGFSVITFDPLNRFS